MSLDRCVYAVFSNIVYLGEHGSFVVEMFTRNGCSMTTKKQVRPKPVPNLES